MSDFQRPQSINARVALKGEEDIPWIPPQVAVFLGSWFDISVNRPPLGLLGKGDQNTGTDQFNLLAPPVIDSTTGSRQSNGTQDPRCFCAGFETKVGYGWVIERTTQCPCTLRVRFQSVNGRLKLNLVKISHSRSSPTVGAVTIKLSLGGARRKIQRVSPVETAQGIGAQDEDLQKGLLSSLIKGWVALV